MASSLVSYARKLGWAEAMRVYTLKMFKKSGEVALQLPGLPAPVFARLGTSDLGMLQQVLIAEEYAFEAHDEPRLIIDAGANVGYASVYLASRYPAATIIAIEPDAENFRLLEKNTAAYPKVRCIRAGLWSHDCYLKVSNPDESSCAFRVEEVKDPNGALPAITLGKLLTESGAERIDILKIDIEGAEVEVFAAADSASWIARTDLIMIELHDRFIPGCEAAMMKAVEGERFKFSQRGENTFLAREF